jgi:hypothetical protein
MGEGFSNRFGEMAVRRTTSLPWEFLETVFGLDVDDFIHELARSAYATELDGRTAEALALAVRYVEGWRPDRDDD